MYLLRWISALTFNRIKNPEMRPPRPVSVVVGRIEGFEGFLGKVGEFVKQKLVGSKDLV